MHAWGGLRSSAAHESATRLTFGFDRSALAALYSNERMNEGGRRRLAVGRDTKEKILDAAERLFAEAGFSGTSLRAITTRAGVNLAAVNYHFGSKDALVEAVFARRLVPMNDARLRRLGELARRHGVGRIPLHRLVEAFVGPALALSGQSGPGPVFIKLLGRSYTEPAPHLQAAVRSMYEEVIAAYKSAFAAALPWLPREELHWRLHFLVGALAYCMSGSDMMRLIASARVVDSPDLEALTRRLTGFLTAGLESATPAVDIPGDMAANV